MFTNLDNLHWTKMHSDNAILVVLFVDFVHSLIAIPVNSIDQRLLNVFNKFLTCMTKSSAYDR